MTLALLALILGGPVAGAAIGVRYARRFGYRQGYQRAYAEQEILVDDLREEINHLEQWTAELAKQQQRRAA